jgi:S1-C subfamily serine protease
MADRLVMSRSGSRKSSERRCEIAISSEVLRLPLRVCFAAFLALVASQALSAEPLTSSELAKVRAAEAARVEAIDRVYGSVVAIFGNDRGGGGSGVLYDPAGFALTNYHVVAGAGVEGWAGLADGKLYRWKLIGMDPGGDVAIIQLTGKDRFPIAPLGNSDSVRVGDFAMAMGNPFVLAEDLRPTVTLGIVSGIKRYQPGEGGATMLVYGNCIQVDSSINPGNSGGPLFNMATEVIGINGRGSFKERGRVNVGVGYAISIEQIKNFIPELLATKTALHGTLDATFGNRGGKVICEQINLDTKIAELGLALGDRLISFDGEPIEDANEYTNLVTTIPAGWPVEVVFEHEGQKKTVWLRLPDLPYPKTKKETPVDKKPDGKKPEEKKPEDKKPDDKPKDEKKPEGEPAKDTDDDPFGETPKPAGETPKAPEPNDDKPAPDKPAPDKPMPKLPDPRRPGPPMPQRPQLPQTEPGKISNLELNQAQYRRIVARWAEFAGGRATIDAAKAFEFECDLLRDGKNVGSEKLMLGVDGRFRVEYQLDGKRFAAGYDGADYWSQENDSPATKLAATELQAEPLVAAAMSLARLVKTDGMTSQLAHFELQGSDRAAGERAYRLRLSLVKDDHEAFVWLSMYDAAGQPMVRLLKTGIGANGAEVDLAVTYRDEREIAGVRLPHAWTVVEGLAEREKFSAVARSSQSVGEVSAETFAMPKG